mmetsp:Transcript_74541/g.189128  ORF Transcript_74541/g.189128 Transcript_74541/m.189128 type:complete len:433 (-) Transcript_74541:73-1371(-)
MHRLVGIKKVSSATSWRDTRRPLMSTAGTATTKMRTAPAAAAPPAGAGGFRSFGAGPDDGGDGQPGLFDWLSRGFRRLSDSVMNLVRAFIFGAGRAGAGLGIGGPVSGESLRATIAEAYGPGLVLPVFAEGNFSQALRAARQDLKLVVVYLHSPVAQHSRSFCTGVLGNEFVCSMLDSSFLFWAGDVSRGETHAVAMMVQAVETPCLAVILPASVDDVRVLGIVSGEVQGDSVVALLTSCLDEMDAHRAESVARTEQQAEDRMLREQQDQEYQEAMEMDRKRQEEKRRQTEEQKEAERLAEEKRLEEQKGAECQEASRLAREEEKRRRAVALGPESSEATARIALRLPAGQRIQRRFSPSATLEEVYAWAEVASYLPENEGKGLEVPDRFVLKTNFPSCDLTERERTVEELQLAGSNILLAEIEEDDEEAAV